MDILGQLSQTEKTKYNINGVEMNLGPLDGTMILALGKKAEGDEVETMYKMIHNTLKQVDPNVTYDGVCSLPMNVLKELTTAVVELNGLKEE